MVESLGGGGGGVVSNFYSTLSEQPNQENDFFDTEIFQK